MIIMIMIDDHGRRETRDERRLEEVWYWNA